MGAIVSGDRPGNCPAAGCNARSSSQEHLMFVLRSREVRPTFTCDRYGRSWVQMHPVLFGRTTGRLTNTEVEAPVDSAMTPASPTRARRKMTHLLGVGVVAAGALLAACSSSSSTPTTTSVPPGGKLSASNAAFIAADLTAPAGSLTA